MPTKISTNNFILYGLNRYRNFLHTPVDSEGKKMDLIFWDKDDVKEFCTNLLHEHLCPDSAIFCVFNDGVMLAIIKIWDEDDRGKYEFIAAKDMHFFAELDGGLRFCCYGLICEISPGHWAIQE